MEEPKVKRRKALRIGLMAALGAALALVFASGLLILLVLAGAFGPLPGRQELEQIRNPVATEIYSADGVLMGTYHIQNRQYLEPDQVTAFIRHALIATEDARFYRHRGIDFRSLGRVFFKSVLLRKESSGGGSTLSQQLAKNLYPRQKSGFLSMPVNKIREMIMAVRIEKTYSKEEILLTYLGTVPFGENTFGIRSAALLYFSREPRQLSMQEAAALVGMLKANQLYNPVRNPERSTGKAKCRTGPDGTKRLPGAGSGRFPAIPSPSYRIPSHAPRCGDRPLLQGVPQGRNGWLVPGEQRRGGESYNLYTDGLKIYTTIDSRLQEYAEEAVQHHLAILQDLFERQWRDGNLWEGITGEQLLINYDGEYRREMDTEKTRPMEVFTWKGMVEREYNTLDSIRHYLQFLQAGFLAMEVSTGQLKAWVGGINHHYFKYDHVLARRQAGSAFKPLVYLAALEKGIAPCDYFPNDSVVYTGYDDWTPPQCRSQLWRVLLPERRIGALRQYGECETAHGDRD